MYLSFLTHDFRRTKSCEISFSTLFQGLLTVDSDVSCSGQADNVFLPSRYCNIFHQCLSGTRFDVRCARANDVPYDLWFNPQTKLCDWPCRVQCNGPIYLSSSTAQQIQSDSLAFFNNDCRAYPLIFNTNKEQN